MSFARGAASRVVSKEILPSETFEDQWIIRYPAGGQFSSGVGTNLLDFRRGTIKLYDGSSDQLNASLKSLKLTAMRTLYLWCDQEINLNFKFKGNETGLVNYDQCLVFDGVAIPFDVLEMQFGLPGNFELVASTSLYPWSIDRLVSHQMRYSSGITSDTFSLARWQATEIAGSRSNPSPQFTNTVLHMPNIRSKSFMVFNTGNSNSLDVNLQGKGDAGSSLWVDDPATGASLSIGSGASQLLALTNVYHFMRLRVRSSTPGSPSSFEAHYIGMTI